jgi:hypothetical protein
VMDLGGGDDRMDLGGGDDCTVRGARGIAIVSLDAHVRSLIK